MEDIKSIAKEYEGLSESSQKAKFESVKSLLSGQAMAIDLLNKRKIQAEAELKEITDALNKHIEEVRKAWGPFLSGMTSAELKFESTGLVLTAKEQLSITVEDQDAANDWFLKNGFEGVMKWQIHNQTAKKIAREQYEDKDRPVEIPGCSYKKFNIIKVK